MIREIKVIKKLVVVCIGILLLYGSGCSRTSEQVTELKRFPLDSLDGIITRSGVVIDKEHSADGKGSLRLTVPKPSVVRLFEIPDVEVENARLMYNAKVRTEGVEGQVYLEMWCHFPGKGEFFSRNPHTALTGTTDWTTIETVFFLKKGEKPDYIKINLVINGKGTVWIDDIRLIKGPLS